MESSLMARTDLRDPLPAPTESGPEATVVWPDPSPLDAWWQRIMHADPVRRDAA
ncbi:hypothetical protein IFM12275_07670 [Nocardia sputorum]|uniref:hypothetical protein n=1 Tax=Nocardia TaxID=1817 RepID=UPI00249100D4|nr:hypothetical protein [Nocardia sputorum]BDT90791.1 hypothetical protein IFM12275_07670 [Nocardia sputorum]